MILNARDVVVVVVVDDDDDGGGGEVLFHLFADYGRGKDVKLEYVGASYGTESSLSADRVDI